MKERKKTSNLEVGLAKQLMDNNGQERKKERKKDRKKEYKKEQAYIQRTCDQKIYIDGH